MKFISGAVLLCALCCLGIYAQENAEDASQKTSPQTEQIEAQPPKQEASAQDVRDLLAEVMVARLSKRLAMDAQQTVQLVRRFTDFREELQRLQRAQEEQLAALKIALAENAETEIIEELLQQALAYDEEAAAARREFFDALRADMTPWQQAQLYVFITDFEEDLRQLIHRAREQAQEQQDAENGDANAENAPALIN